MQRRPPQAAPSRTALWREPRDDDRRLSRREMQKFGKLFVGHSFYLVFWAFISFSGVFLNVLH
jgi:hypothetical protein